MSDKQPSPETAKLLLQLLENTTLPVLIKQKMEQEKRDKDQ